MDIKRPVCVPRKDGESERRRRAARVRRGVLSKHTCPRPSRGRSLRGQRDWQTALSFGGLWLRESLSPLQDGEHRRRDAGTSLAHVGLHRGLRRAGAWQATAARGGGRA